MFKQFLLLPNCSFDLKGNYKLNGIDVNTESDLLILEINNVLYNFSKKWLGLICHYEINLLIKDILNIDFVICNSKVIGLKCGYLMIFKKPIYHGDGFYIIPGFTNFAINKNGIIKSLKFGRLLKSAVNSYGYPYVNMYDPDKGRWRSVCIHILLARTFITNKDPSSLFFVNHKNGIKLDFNLKNLEWVSSLRNNIHAIENGLRKDNVPCKIRDIETLDITHFPSIGICLKTLGFSRTNVNILKKFNNTQIPHLLFNRYEIKLEADTSNWFYTKENKDVIKYLNTGPYEAKNTLTGMVYEASTIRELAEKIEISEDKISCALKQLIMKSFDNFLIRKKSSEHWPEKFEQVIFYKPRKFLLTNKITREEIYFDSLRKVTAFLGIDKRTIKLRLTNNYPYKEWEIKEI